MAEKDLGTALAGILENGPVQEPTEEIAAPVVEEQADEEAAAEPAPEGQPAEQAAVEQPTPEQAADAAPSDMSWLTELFGVSEASPDAIRQAVEAERLEKQGLTEKIAELSSKPSEKFANDTVRKFNAFVDATGIEDYSIFKRIDSITVSPESNITELAEAIVAAKILENPDDAAIADKLRNQIVRENTINLDEDSTDEEREDAEIKKYRLLSEARRAVDKINDVKSKMVPEAPAPVDTEALKAKEEENKAKWDTVIGQGLANLKIEIPKVAEKDGKVTYLADKVYEANFDDNQKADYELAFREFLKASKMPEPSKEVLDQAHSFAFKEAVIHNFPKIIADAVSKAVAEEAKKYATDTDNPSAVRAEAKPSGGGSGASLGDALINTLGGF